MTLKKERPYNCTTIKDLIDEDWDIYPPDKSIGFIMSDNKKADTK